MAWGGGLLLHVQELKQLGVREEAQAGDALAVEAVLPLVKKQVESEELRVEAGQHEGEHQAVHPQVPEWEPPGRLRASRVGVGIYLGCPQEPLEILLPPQCSCLQPPPSLRKHFPAPFSVISQSTDICDHLMLSFSFENQHGRRGWVLIHI